MTNKEAHDKVNEWVDICKSEYIVSDTNAHHFGKVNLHAVIDEIFNVHSDFQLLQELKKLKGEKLKFKSYIKDGLGGERNRDYILSNIKTIQSNIKKIEDRIKR